MNAHDEADQLAAEDVFHEINVGFTVSPADDGRAVVPVEDYQRLYMDRTRIAMELQKEKDAYRGAMLLAAVFFCSLVLILILKGC